MKRGVDDDSKHIATMKWNSIQEICYLLFLGQGRK
jgi:hypothetical protein